MLERFFVFVLSTVYLLFTLAHPVAVEIVSLFSWMLIGYQTFRQHFFVPF